MPELKAVLWDHDGTLVDTEPFWIRAQLDMAARYGFPWTEEDSYACVGSPMDESASRMKLRGVPLTIDEIIEEETGRVIDMIREKGAPFLPGVFELFAEMREHGIRGAIVSNAWRNIVELDASFLPEGAIEFILAGDEMLRAKPDPWPYAHALDRLELAAENCIVIEDSYVGTLSAEAAGIPVLVVPSVVDVPEKEGRSRARSLADVNLDTLRRIVNGEVLSLEGSAAE